MQFKLAMVAAICLSSVITTPSYAGSSFPEGRPPVSAEVPSASQSSPKELLPAPKGYYQYTEARGKDLTILAILDNDTLNEEVTMRRRDFTRNCMSMADLFSESNDDKVSAGCYTRAYRVQDAQAVLTNRGK